MGEGEGKVIKQLGRLWWGRLSNNSMWVRTQKSVLNMLIWDTWETSTWKWAEGRWEVQMWRSEECPGMERCNFSCVQSTFTFATLFISPTLWLWLGSLFPQMKTLRFRGAECLTPSRMKDKQWCLEQNQAYCVYSHMLWNSLNVVGFHHGHALLYSGKSTRAPPGYCRQVRHAPSGPCTMLIGPMSAC